MKPQQNAYEMHHRDMASLVGLASSTSGSVSPRGVGVELREFSHIHTLVRTIESIAEPHYHRWSSVSASSNVALFGKDPIWQCFLCCLRDRSAVRSLTPPFSSPYTLSHAASAKINDHLLKQPSHSPLAHTHTHPPDHKFIHIHVVFPHRRPHRRHDNHRQDFPERISEFRCQISTLTVHSS